MAEFKTIRGSFDNPGDGHFRIYRKYGEDMRTITVEDTPGATLSGVLTFFIGTDSVTVMDLAAGHRARALAGPVPYVDLIAAGLNPAEKFTVVLR